MSLIILEGLDKTGKSTVAEYFRQKRRYEYIHMTSPAKRHTPETYLSEMLHVIALTAGKNVVIDRSWFGELVWPEIFGRSPLLTQRDCVALTEIARCLHKDGVELIHMNDPNVEAHLARIAKFKEPTYDFHRARQLYSYLGVLGFNDLTFQETEARGWN